jgi:ABC-type sulfate/molybdate transport systems ATPase subunit
VALALCYHEACEFGGVRERVESVLERTGVTAWADRYPQRLSRSLRQRVALARALAQGPDVLFLDNPLGALDAGQTRWWIEFLRQWMAGVSAVDGSPLTLVVASDDLRPWLTAARQFGVIRGRRWESLGGADAIRGSRDGLVRDLLAEEAAG